MRRAGKNTGVYITAIVLAVIASYVSVQLFLPKTEGEIQKKESAYERVLRTGTIRCAYATWPPFLVKDPNTGQLSGLSYDYMMELGRLLNLKVEWMEEVGWGNYIEGLNTRRYDMMCNTEWPDGHRSARTAMSLPAYYSAIYAYVRGDDARLDGNLQKVNDPAIRVAVIEGDVTYNLARLDYPKAALWALPQEADVAQLLMDVASGKADVVFVDEGVANDFLASNPGQIRQVAGTSPARMIAEAYPLPAGDAQFKFMIDTMILTLTNDGYVAKLLRDKYPEQASNSFPPLKQFSLPSER